MSSECTVTIQDVFNRFYPEYERSHKLSAVHRKAAYHIMNCKTGAKTAAVFPSITIPAETGVVLCARSFQGRNG